MVTFEDVRSLAATLPRSYEVVAHGRVKFRVGQIVYLAFSHDQTLLEFAFPKAFREALVDSDPDKFLMPRPSDLRFNWVGVRLDALDEDEMRDFVIDAWCMVVPKRVAREHLELPAISCELSAVGSIGLGASGVMSEPELPIAESR